MAQIACKVPRLLVFKLCNWFTGSYMMSYVFPLLHPSRPSCIFRGGECQHYIPYWAGRAAATVPAGGDADGNMPRVPGHDRHIGEAGTTCRQMFRVQ